MLQIEKYLRCQTREQCKAKGKQHPKYGVIMTFIKTWGSFSTHPKNETKSCHPTNTKLDDSNNNG
ncbi:hypothetical protein VIBNISFn118_300150 [Vibrio nigripulchritudo SFn118]|nr:hypothetical protein VIBNISFn118_300150 [Vibrio nigripulchritudo SFn118]